MVFSNFLRWIVVLLGMALAQVQAQTTPIPAPIAIDHAFTERSIGLDIAIFEDSSAQLGLEDVRQPLYAQQFKPSIKLNPSFGFTRSNYWVRFGLQDARNNNERMEAGSLFLTLAYANTDVAQLWCYDDQGSQTLYQRVGDHVPISEWPTSYREPTFQIHHASDTCWLMVQGGGASMQLPLQLRSRDAFASKRLIDTAIQAMYFGALLVMIAYNGLVAVAIRSRAYGAYVLFLSSYGLSVVSFNGFGYAVLWSDAVGWADFAVPFFTNVAGLSSLMFANTLLDIRTQSPRFWKLSLVTMFLFGTHLLTFWFVRYPVAIQWVLTLIPIWAIVLLGVGCVLAYRGIRIAKIYVVAWFVFITGTLILMASTVGLISSNILTQNAVQIGSAVEFVLLSFALSDRIKTYQAALLSTKQALVDTLMSSEQKLMQKVDLRTTELKQSNAQLQQAYQEADASRQRAENAHLEAQTAQQKTANALEELQSAQAQLIQSEKMASLGLLVSNVAHEINTPIGAVKSSGSTMADALDTTLEELPRLFEILQSDARSAFISLVKDAKSHHMQMSSREERAFTKQVAAQLEQAGVEGAQRKARLMMKLHAYAKVQDYVPLLIHPEADYILGVAGNIADMINSTNNINTAVDKVSRIVFSLKSLSGDNTIKDVSVGHLYIDIEKVLDTFQPQLQQVDVVRKYGDMAPLSYDHEALQQVMTHLIMNALQSMHYKGMLMIQLRAIDNQAEIKITDFGGGIPEEHQSRIFEPFFTTRTSGEGSGMGLAIVRRVVESHRGTIDFQSEVGVGTTFTIRFPYTT